MFNLTDDPVDESLVAVMMPFDARFDPVYAACIGAATGLNMTCQRGDDIWDHDHIIQDVVSLIGRSKVVICDLTDPKSQRLLRDGDRTHARPRLNLDRPDRGRRPIRRCSDSNCAQYRRRR